MAYPSTTWSTRSFEAPRSARKKRIFKSLTALAAEAEAQLQAETEAAAEVGEQQQAATP